jgi:hypothetical protein
MPTFQVGGAVQLRYSLKTMNKTGEERYSANWEKLSKKLRLLYSCAVCGEMDYNKKECHHKDGNKKNGSLENCIVLCTECHFLVHQNKQSIPQINYIQNNKSIILEIGETEKWINKESKIELVILDSKTAMNFRKRYVKGWIKPGACNFYIGMLVDAKLKGVLGFQNPDFGLYDIVMKADTTSPNDNYSTDLLLYLLRTKETKKLLEQKFCRQINTIYSTCFSVHNDISRYRKHGTLAKKTKTDGGFNISYLFQIGNISTIKEAKSLFFQKHKEL